MNQSSERAFYPYRGQPKSHKSLYVLTNTFSHLQEKWLTEHMMKNLCKDEHWKWIGEALLKNGALNCFQTLLHYSSSLYIISPAVLTVLWREYLLSTHYLLLSVFPGTCGLFCTPFFKIGLQVHFPGLFCTEINSTVACKWFRKLQRRSRQECFL